MTPYILVLLFVMLWMVLEKKALNRNSFWVPLLTLISFAAIRSYRVGTDTGLYTLKFRNNFYIDNFKISEHKEYGYQLFEYALLNFSHNYFWLLFTSSIIVVACYLKTIKKLSDNYIYSVFLFITLGTYTFFFNGLRQGIAMAIFSLATPYLIEKRLIPFLMVTLLASLFHVSALFMIPFYFILNVNIKNSYKYFITFLSSLLGSNAIILYLASDNPRYEAYTEANERAGGYFILAFHILLMIVLSLIKRNYHIKDKKFTSLLTYYSIGVFFIIPVTLIGTSASGPQRLLKYFTWVSVLLIPIALKKMNNIIIYLLSILLAIIYFTLTTSKFSNLAPYYLNPLFKVI